MSLESEYQSNATAELDDVLRPIATFDPLALLPPQFVCSLTTVFSDSRYPISLKTFERSRVAMDLNLSSSFPAMNNTSSFHLGWSVYMSTTFFGLMTVLTVVFNSFALVVLHRWHHEFEEICRTLFLNLAIINMASGVFTGVFEGMIFYLDQGHVFERFCWLIPSVGTFTLFSCIYHVALMNLQRYLAISHPFWYMRFATVKRLSVLYLVMDLAFIGISSPFFPVPNLPFNEFARSLCRHKTIIFSKIDGSNISIFYAIFGLLYTFPLVVLTYTNIRLLIIARRVGRQRNAVPVQHDAEAVNANVSAPGLKGLRTVLIITGLFYLSIVPSFLFVCLMILPTSLLSRQGYDTIFFLGNAVLVCSCWWNVPIYMSTCAKLRQRARDLRQRLKCCKKA